MSRCLSLHVGEFFSEASLRPASETIHLRFANARWSSEKILSHIKVKFAFDPEVLLLNYDLKADLLKGRTQAPAIITNSGFEDWLKLSWPEPPNGAFFDPVSFINPDFCFGVTQRVDAQGHVLESLKSEEIEFLIAKLKMIGCRSVAVGLLNSHLNNEGEIELRNRLNDEGFVVYCSSDLSIGSEKERWSWALLSATLDPLFDVFKSRLDQSFTDLGWSPRVFIFTSVGFKDFSEKEARASTLLATEHLLQQSIESENFCFFGVESFYESFQHSKNHLMAPWHFSPKNSNWPKVKKSLLQPSLLLARGPYDIVTWTDIEAGFEPGPICLGKGLRPTWLDIFSTVASPEFLVDLYEVKIGDARYRIREQLLQIAPSEFSLKNIHELEYALLKESFFRVASDRGGAFLANIDLYGPLAEAISKWLKKPVSSRSRLNSSKVEFLSDLLIEAFFR